MKKHKIAFYEAHFSFFTGAQQSLLCIMSLLKENGHEVTLILAGEGELANQSRANNIHVCIVPYSQKTSVINTQLNSIKNLYKLLNYNLRIRKLLVKLEADFLVCNNHIAVLLTGLAGKSARKKLIWNINSDRKNHLTDTFALLISNEIITISEGVKNMFSIGSFKKHEHKFTTIHTGFPLEKFSKNLAIINPSDKIIIGIVGTIHEGKGYTELIEVFKRISDKYNHVDLHIAGKPPHNITRRKYLDNLDKTILSYEIENRVHFKGWYANIETFLAEIDIFIQMSRNEGLPRAVIEAMAMHIPVVATKAGGTYEAVEDEKSGFLIDIGDTEEAINKLSFFIENKDARIAFGKRGREIVEEKFQPDVYLKNFEAVLNKYAKTR